jgi:hypothetical protein
MTKKKEKRKKNSKKEYGKTIIKKTDIEDSAKWFGINIKKEGFTSVEFLKYIKGNVKINKRLDLRLRTIGRRLRKCGYFDKIGKKNHKSNAGHWNDFVIYKVKPELID